MKKRKQSLVSESKFFDFETFYYDCIARGFTTDGNIIDNFGPVSVRGRCSLLAKNEINGAKAYAHWQRLFGFPKVKRFRKNKKSLVELSCNWFGSTSANRIMHLIIYTILPQLTFKELAYKFNYNPNSSVKLFYKDLDSIRSIASSNSYFSPSYDYFDWKYPIELFINFKNSFLILRRIRRKKFSRKKICLDVTKFKSYPSIFFSYCNVKTKR